MFMLPKLQVLDLSCNNVRSFLNVSGGYSIEELILSSNHIKNDGTIDVFLQLPKLWLLGLSSNSIHRLNSNTINKTLELLDLSDNNLQNLN